MQGVYGDFSIATDSRAELCFFPASAVFFNGRLPVGVVLHESFDDEELHEVFEGGPKTPSPTRPVESFTRPLNLGPCCQLLHGTAQTVDMNMSIGVREPSVVQHWLSVVVVPHDWGLQIFGEVKLDSATCSSDVRTFWVHLDTVQYDQMAARRSTADGDRDRHHFLGVLFGGFVSDPPLSAPTRRHVEPQPDAVGYGSVQQI